MADTDTIRYRAFLSYAHADMARAKWLHAALEGFRIDKDLVGRATPLGPVPKTLRPIFRDREDFSGGHTLTDATIAALDASSALIVLCSTVAATRAAVNEEVRLFRSRHPERPVIPVIVEGDWPENVPHALRYEIAPDGTVTDRPVTILGPDLRESSDGKALGLAKVVAGLIGVPSDDIVRRAERAKRRRNRFWAALAGVFLMLAVVATGSAVYAWHQLKTNEALLERTLGRATDLVNTAIAQAELYGVSRALTLKLLEQAEGLFSDLAELGRETPQLRHKRAWMLIAFSKNYEILGDTAKQLARLAEARRLLSGLVAEEPDDWSYQSTLSIALSEHGDVMRVRGNLDEALESHRSSLAVAERLVAADPGNMLWRNTLAKAQDGVADVQLLQGKLEEALESYRRSLAIREQLAAADSTNVEKQRDVANSGDKIGNVLRAQGKFDEALASYNGSLAIAERLAADDGSNTDRQRDLLVSRGRIGDVLADQGKLDEALAAYRATFSVGNRLGAIDPKNAVWQRDLSVTHSKIGDVLRRQGKLGEAMESYRADLAVAERLEAIDSSNAEWQHGLSISHERIGDLMRTQDKLDEALTSFRESNTIRDRLAKGDPNNVTWQHSLAISSNNLGTVLAARGQLTEALTSFREGLAIRERLAKINPNNAAWQRDVAASYKVVGLTLMIQGRAEEALAPFQSSLAVAERIAETDNNSTRWLRELLASYAGVGDELLAQGHPVEALGLFSAILTVAEKLSGVEPSNTGSQSDLVVAYGKVGDALVSLGRPAEALTYLRGSLAIAERLAKADDGSNAKWRWDVLVSHFKLATLGDEPARRWAYIVTEMHKLKKENRLEPDWARYLPLAEEQLAKFTKGQAVPQDAATRPGIDHRRIDKSAGGKAVDRRTQRRPVRP